MSLISSEIHKNQNNKLMEVSVEHGENVESMDFTPKSNVLHREHRYKMMEIFPILLNIDRSVEPIKISPSSFNHEMQMTTEERLRKLANPLRKCDVLYGQQTPPPQYFKPSPRIIIFQNFTPGEVYNTILSLRNSCKVLKAICMTCEESHYFSVKYGFDSHTRVAPGMTISVTVQFRPEEEHDYTYQISFTSENESIVIPVIALAPRPMLDFPDDITVSPGPVKICNTKMLMVRNISKIPAVFSLIAESPFSVEPTKGVLRASELMHVNISAQTSNIGEFNGFLTIKYETGELLYSSLHAKSENIIVYTSKGSIKMEDTFLGLKWQRSLKIHNDSNHLVQFKWKKMATTEEELHEVDKLTQVFGTLKEMETRKCVKLDILNIIDPESHAVVYDRIYDDEVKALKNEDFLFTHNNFSLLPISGEIWPHNWIDILVVFEPDKAKLHTVKAYCDVSGREDRIPLEIIGVGVGPRLAFNLDSLDIGSIFLNTTHCYEVVITNSGLISGTIMYRPSQLKCGGELTCVPESHSLIAEAYASFVISFSSSIQGQFIEELLFQVLEADEMLRIEFKGTIVSPIIHFDVKFLELGDVSIGFPLTYSVSLNNPSIVPVPFSLKMREDGTEQSITYKMYAAQSKKETLPLNPKEFIIEPSGGIVDAYSSLIIKITFIPNICRSKNIVLTAEMEEYKSEPILLPISYSAQFPLIECTTTDINIRFCFINYPYMRNLILENKSVLPGFFYIIPQQVTSYTTMTFSTSFTQGVLKAQSKMKIPLTIMTNSLGKQSLSISLLVLGETFPKLCCNLVCNGQGPVVSINPHFLTYGAIKLLEPTVQQLTITNDSPVPADFMASIGKSKSPWSITPQKGVLYSEETAVFNVSVYLTDTGIYRDFVLIQVHNSRSLTVNMSAEGIGTSLVLEPPICPIYNMGPLFSHTLIQRELTITNKGSKHHQVLWCSQRDIKEFSRATVDIISNNIFNIIPMKVDLSGGDQATLILEGRSDSTQTVSEQFYCHAIIENTGKKQTLLTSKITASFIEPKVIFSKSEVLFCIDIGPNECFRILQDKIDITSLSSLPHNIIFKIDHPFKMLGEDDMLLSEKSVAVESLGKISVTIVFDPSYKTDLYSWIAKGFLHVHYKEHSHVDSMALHGEVNFPNVVPFPNFLNFGSIPVGSEVVKEFVLINTSPLPISYSWHWINECTKIEFLESKEANIPAEDTEEPELKEITWVVGDTKETEVETSETNLTSECDISTRVTNWPELPGWQFPGVTEQVNNLESFPPETNMSQMLKHKMFPLVARLFQEETELDALKVLPLKKQECTMINKLFDITPFYGKLDPKESQTVTVTFIGYKSVSAEAEAECRIEGGPTEKLHISGKAANICYCLSKDIIDFGHQLFCIPCSNTFMLYNMGPLSFNYQMDTSECVLDCHMKPGMLMVSPRSGCIEGYDMVEFTVKYFPGMSSGFQKFFHIEIGYLDPIEMQVRGFGVFPQIHIYLPRPSMCYLSPHIGYKAIAGLTADWLTVKNIQTYCHSIDDELHTIPILENEIMKLEENKWVIISSEDICPSIADINLAVERVLAYQFVEDNPYILLHLSSQLKRKPIPQFIVPPYEIDLGIVQVETTVYFTALMYNFGPCAVSATLFHTIKKSFLVEKGLFITFHNIEELPAHQTSAIQVLFSPQKASYPLKHNDLHYIFYLEIVNGANIPIFINGVVTVPYLKLSTNIIDFESVKCGQCKEISFILRNEGLVPCQWTGILQNKSKRACKKTLTKLPIISVPTEEQLIPVFIFKSTNNYLKPKQESYVEVYFQPNSKGLREMTLVILVENNIERLQVKLKGVGVEPTLVISDPYLEFNPTLPYSQCEEKLFTVTNPCSFPVEVVFTDFDSQILEEENILRVLCHYYKSDDVLMPPRTAGEKLPSVIIDFYNKLVVDAMNKLNQEKEKEEFIKFEVDIEEKRLKKKGGGSKPHSIVSQSVINIPQVTAEPVSIRNPDEVEQLVHEYIEELHQLENFSVSDNDPIKLAFLSTHLEEPDKSPKNGILIFFHGAPCTEYIHMAHKTAKALDLVVLNMDQIILEAAACSHTLEAIKVRDLLQAQYAEQMKSAPEELEGNDEDKGDTPNSELDFLEKLTKITVSLVEQMCASKPFLEVNSKPNKKVEQNIPVHKGTTSQPNSQQSNRHTSARRSQIGDDMTQNVTLAGISLDILQEILKNRFQMQDCRQGVVIDSLNSMFFTNACIALTTLLRAAGNIKYIHCIILNNSYTSYSNWLINKKTSEEAEVMANYNAKLERFKTLSNEDAELLTEDDQELYMKIMLSDRRQKLKLKKEVALKKHQEKLQREQLKKLKSKKTPKKGQMDFAKKHRPPSTFRMDGEVLLPKSVISPDSDELKKKPKQKDSNTKLLGLDIISEEVKKKKSSKAHSKQKSSSNMNKQIQPTNEDEKSYELLLEFKEFESDYHEILLILENWERKKGTTLPMFQEKPITGQPTKGKTNRRTRRVSNGPAQAKFSTTTDVVGNKKSMECLETFVSGEGNTMKVDYGVPVWLVNFIDLSKPKDDIIINLLTNSSQIQDVRLNIVEMDHLKPKDQVSFDFVSAPKRRETVASGNIFVLSLVDPQEADILSRVESSEDTVELPEKSSVSTPRLRNLRKKRKKSALDVNISAKKEKKFLPSIIEFPKFKSRWTLAPQEKLQLKVCFEPRIVGEYTQIYTLEIMGMKTVFEVKAFGLCDLPRIDTDPIVLFPNVSDSKDSNSITKFTHYLDKNIFDFGAVLIAKLKEKRLHHVSTKFNISNCSMLVAEVQFGFLDKLTDKVDAFGFEPNIITLEPGCSQPLTVYASPHSLGTIQETLFCSIKDNPVIERIKIACQSIKVDFEVDTKTILFDHLLMYHKESRFLTLINKSLVPLLWRFLGMEQFQEDFVISSTEGLILPLEKHKVTFNYLTDKVKPVSKRSLRLEVYDEEGRGDPVYVETITVIAETIDVMLDFTFTHPDKHHIAFGEVKVGYEYNQPVQLKNKGKYDFLYKIEVQNLPKLAVPNLYQMVSITPITGTVPRGEKPVTVRVMCTPLYEFDVPPIPLLKCYIMDRTNVVAIIPINFSIASFYSRHIISPMPDINFGVLTVGTRKTLDLNITNVGMFDFKYTISKSKNFAEEDLKARGSGDAKKFSRNKRTLDKIESKVSSAKGRGKSNKLVDTITLVTGVFNITAASGIVLPSQSATVHVDCNADYEDTFCEEIIVNFSEPSPVDKTGTPIQLLAIGCMQTMDFTDIESIFQEHYICQSFAEFHCPLEVGNHCVYSKNEEKLMFCCVCIGTKATARLRLHNPGLVSCELNMTLTSVSTKGSKSTNLAFTVSPAKLSIQPYSLEMVEVTFSPMLMETYTSTLELNMDMVLPSKTTKLSVKLSGEGYMPMITLISPAAINKGGNSSLMFRPLLLGQSSTLQLAFQNTGIIPAKVIVELNLNADNMFSLYPHQDTIPLLKLWTPDEPIKHTTVITVAPKQSASFYVAFEPREVGRFHGEVKLFVVDNPFENFSVTLHGESFMEDIAFDNLPMLYFSKKSKQDINDPGTAQYQLDFGKCYVNKSNKTSFKITNHSKTDTYRFEWEVQPNIVFSPTTGHLQPKETKDILATFLSSCPVTYTKVIICSIVKFLYPITILGMPSWDDRVKVVHWVVDHYDKEINSFLDQDPWACPTMKHKVVETKSEPEFEEVGGTNRTIPVLTSAVVDYASFSCDIEKIDFLDTLIFQNRVFEFKFSNNGCVPLKYCWIVTIDEHYPTLPSSSTVLNAMNSLVDTSSEVQSRTLTSSFSVQQDSGVNVHFHKSRKRAHSAYITKLGPCHFPDCDFVEVIPESQRMSTTTKEELLSSLANVSDRSNDTWMESDYMPFQVYPECGTLNPNEVGTCSVSFAPLNVFDYKAFLIFKVSHLNPNETTKKIIITARSLMPFCHFDVDESDYITSGRRDPSRPGPIGHSLCLPLNPNTRAIEFNVVGLGGTHVKNFQVINPTEVNYTFSWHNISVSNPSTLSTFHCATMDGLVASGKQTEVVFSFTAQNVGTFESFWNFCILEHNIEIPFLLVAIVTEPAVSFLTSHISLCPTLLGISTTKNVMLVNNEDTHLMFNFMTGSLFSEGCQQQLKLEPLSGVLIPNSQISIMLEFTPSLPGETIFLPRCNIKGLKKPLELSVSGMCYIVQPSVSYECGKNSLCTLDANSTNIIDLGELHPKKMETVTFQITNIGKVSFYYYWKYDEECMNRSNIKLSFLEKGGHITSQSRTVCKMSVTISKKTRLKDINIILQISRGPHYAILLQGSTVELSFNFSFYNYNFGFCLFDPTTLFQYNTKLYITNKEEAPLGVECFFINQPHLTVEAINTSVPPHESIEVPITFHPRAWSKYEDKIEFIMNGTHKKTVTILGEGTHVKVELVKPHHKTISLGALRTGESTICLVPVINQSKAPITVSFDLVEHPQTPGSISSEVNHKTIFKSGISALKVLPSSSVLLKPKGIVELAIHFTPHKRMKPFTEMISMMIGGEMILPLCIVKGNCIDAEFSLDRNYLPFGAVVEGCSTTLRLMLMNTGDIGARFSWPAMSGNHFSITPSVGYCSPDSEVTFNVVFHPTQLQTNIRTEVACNIENYKSLTLTLTGSCIALPQVKDVVMFNTPVRQQDQKTIALTNKSAIAWDLFPIISGEYFSGRGNVHVPAQGTENYEVIYSPLTMTRENKHSGSVFFQVPDDQGLLYKLIGTTEPPIVNDKISREIICKSKHTELLLVRNWLQVSQRFHAHTEVMKAEKFDPVYSIKGNEYIDVPGKSEREYRFNFYSYRECTLGFKVTFTNKETEEYQYYELVFRILKCGSLQVIKIKSCVRQLITHELKMENPLQSNMSFTISCTVPEVQCPSTFVVPGETEKVMLLEYLPVIPGEFSGRLEAFCSDLGTFPYELNLKALPPLPEKPLCYSVALGTSNTKQASVHNFTKTKTEFVCKTDNPTFHVEKLLTVQANNKGTVEVIFEPMSLGNIQGMLTITSTTAGEFIFPLVGTCTSPKPQGPLLLKPGGSTTIPFKNVFSSTKTFSVDVNVPAFIPKNPSETIKSKKEHRINISLASLKNLEVSNLKFPITGKLIITCTDVTLSHISWTYYLKGILE